MIYCPDCNSPLTVKPECHCGYKSHEVPLDRPGVVCTKHHLPSVSNMVVVKKMDGVERVGPFFKYGLYDRRRGRKARLYLRPGFVFVRWELACEECQKALGAQ